MVGQHDTNKVINYFKKVIKAQNLTIMGLAIKAIGNLMGDRSFETVRSSLGCELACEGSWQKIALEVQNHLKRIRNNIEYRLHYMQYHVRKRVEFCDYYVGVSSVMLPNSLVRYGLRLTELDVFINLGPTPRCWFYFITAGSNTQLALDIMLLDVKRRT